MDNVEKREDERKRKIKGQEDEDLADKQKRAKMMRKRKENV